MAMALLPGLSSSSCVRPSAPAFHIPQRAHFRIHTSSPSFSLPLLTTLNPLICRAVNSSQPLDLTEENVAQVLLDARSELLQLFDTSVGITGVAELAEMDGPFLKLRLKGRFWHERSVVLARLGNYLQKRIPEIVEVEIEDESQLDDSPANFGHD